MVGYICSLVWFIYDILLIYLQQLQIGTWEAGWICRMFVWENFWYLFLWGNGSKQDWAEGGVGMWCSENKGCSQSHGEAIWAVPVWRKGARSLYPYIDQSSNVSCPQEGMWSWARWSIQLRITPREDWKLRTGSSWGIKSSNLI